MNAWPTVQLRHVARFKYGDSLAAENRVDGEVAVFGSNGPVGLHDRANTSAPVVIVGRKGSYGKVHFSHRPVFAIDTTYFIDGSSSGQDLRWLYYALSSMGLDRLSQDVGVPGLSRDAAYGERVRLPGPSEQAAIADFLDAETARIDAFIAKKRRMIDALHMRFEVSAKELVSSSAEMVQLRRCVRSIKTGTTPPASEMDILEGDQEAWFSPGDVGGWLAMNPPARTLSRRAIEEGWVPRFPADATLLVGIGATAGRVGHLAEPGTGNQQMTCLVAGEGLLPRFLSWQLWLREDELRATAPYTTLPILNNDFLRSVRLTVPGLRHQRHAVTELDRSADLMHRSVAAIESQVLLLVERRQALITAAVTGELAIPGVDA